MHLTDADARYGASRELRSLLKISGEKGIICRVLPDAYMPVDDYGFRADVIIDPNAHVARMTIGPVYEPAINRTSEFVRRRIASIYPTDPDAAVNTLLDYYNDINPNYALAVRQTMITPESLRQHTEECIANHINLWIPPGLDTIGLELIHMLQRKWQVPLSPVTFTQINMDGEIVNTFRTRNNVCIGSKYVYLLCKIPDDLCASPGVASVNQYNTPMKPHTSDQIRHPIRRTPIRSGEDDFRIMGMDLEDPNEMVRLLCLQGNSPKGLDLLIEQILTSDQPMKNSRVPISNKELIQSNTIIQVFNHFMATMGVGTSTKGPHPLLEDVLGNNRK